MRCRHRFLVRLLRFGLRTHRARGRSGRRAAFDGNALARGEVGQGLIDMTNVNVQELTVQALLTENREHIYHAAMMDPHTAAELDLDQIWKMVDELLIAHDEWLPQWARLPNKKAA